MLSVPSVVSFFSIFFAPRGRKNQLAWLHEQGGDPSGKTARFSRGRLMCGMPGAILQGRARPPRAQPMDSHDLPVENPGQAGAGDAPSNGAAPGATGIPVE